MINILITGIGGGGIGEQILKSLKISSLKLALFGTDITHLCKNKYEVDKFFIIKSANNQEFIDDLLTICRENNISALFPGSEPELLVISKNRTLFEMENIFLPINPDDVIKICLDKVKTMRFLKDNNFNFPKSVTINNLHDLTKVDFFPAVLKPSKGASGSANIMIAQTADEVVVFGKYLGTLYDEFIIQEYIGVPEHEYTVGVLVSMDGEYINSIGLKRIITSGLGCKMKIKNRTGREDLGNQLIISSGISQGEVGKYPAVTKTCVNIAMKLGALSSINIQCRYFKDQVYVFEINPRYSGTTYIRALAGYNEQEILLKKHFFGIDFIVDEEFKDCIILRGLDETKL